MPSLPIAPICTALLVLSLGIPAPTPRGGKPRDLDLVNPNFTPVHLARQAGSIVGMDLAAAVDGKVAVSGGTVLKGEPAPAKVLDISHLPGKEQPLFSGGRALWLTGDFAAAGTRGGPVQQPVAMLYIGTENWYAVYREGEAWVVRAAPFDLASVWAGGSDMLERALTWILAEPKADVPISSGAGWGGERQLGTVPGAVAASLLVDFSSGPALYVAAAGGDRVLGTEAAPGGASRLIAGGDLTGDGQGDVLRWDGAAFSIYQPGQAPLAIPSSGLPDARGLATLAEGSRSVGVVFTAGAPYVLGTTLTTLPTTALGEGFAGASADLDNDGHVDLVQACADGVAIWRGMAGGGFSPPVVGCKVASSGVHSVLVSDLDGDGRLDLILAGTAREHRVLINLGDLRYADRYGDTGELHYHAPEDGSRAAATWDVNLDGRPDILLFSATEGVKSYFNRGYACFGLGRDLLLEPQSELKAVAALVGGAVAGASLDVDSDGQPDVVGVDTTGQAWALLTKPEQTSHLLVTIAAPTGMPGPISVQVQDGNRALGAYRVAAGAPAVLGKPAKGPMTLTWTGPDGRQRVQKAVVLKSQRLDLKP